MRYIENMEMIDSEKYMENTNEITVMMDSKNNKLTICHNWTEYQEAFDIYWKYRAEMAKKRQPHISRFKYIDQPELKESGHYLFEYNILDRKDLSDVLTLATGTLKNIIKDVIDNLGKETKLGRLIGIQITEEDVYYVFDDKGEYNYDSCVGYIPD